MKKLFLSMVAAIVAATATFAQSSTLAVLSHEGQLSTFYGSGALKSALSAANHGDVITLSSGTFDAADITKAVTIRGAGMETDTLTKTYPTRLLANFKIDVPDSLSHRLMIEGVYSDAAISVCNTLKNATFQKCRFGGFTSIYGQTYGYGFMKNVTFLHCKIIRYFSNTNGGNTVLFVNSFVKNPRIGSDGYSNTFEFSNCLIWWDGGGDYTTPDNSYNGTYKNCIIFRQNLKNWGLDTYSLNRSNSIYNCLGVSSDITILSKLFTNFADNAAGATFQTTSNIEGVFSDFQGDYTDAVTFNLTDNAKTKYLGDDGKELGIYGGSLPFSSRVLSPQITKCNVAQKTTADGKLSVDMEVKGVE